MSIIFKRRLIILFLDMSSLKVKHGSDCQIGGYLVISSYSRRYVIYCMFAFAKQTTDESMDRFIAESIDRHKLIERQVDKKN